MQLKDLATGRPLGDAPAAGSTGITYDGAGRMVSLTNRFGETTQGLPRGTVIRIVADSHETVSDLFRIAIQSTERDVET